MSPADSSVGWAGSCLVRARLGVRRPVLLAIVLLTGVGCAPGDAERTRWRAVDARYAVAPTGRMAAVPTAAVGHIRRPVLSATRLVPIGHAVRRDVSETEPVSIPLPPDVSTGENRIIVTYRPIAALRNVDARAVTAFEKLPRDAILDGFSFIAEHPVAKTEWIDGDHPVVKAWLPPKTDGTVLIVAYAATGGELSYLSEALTVPDAAHLRFGIGLQDFDPQGVTRPVRFTVGLRSRADEREVFAYDLGPEELRSHGTWLDHDVDLAAHAGEHVQLAFSVDVAGEPAALPVWSDPIIVETAVSSPPATHRNVVLVSIDTLRADHVGAYGYARPTSPALDSLAADGAVFERAYTSFPQTAGAHMTLLTAMEPCAHGVLGPGAAPLPKTISTLAELLRAAGYDTAAFTENGWITHSTGFARGFSSFAEYTGEGLTEGLADRTFAAAGDWISARPGRPWFVFVHTYQIHEPYDPPDEYLEMLGVTAPVRDLDRYDAEIRYADDVLASFLRRVDEAPDGTDTIVVVTSDHGELFGEHGLVGHDNSLFEGVLHVPLVVRATGDIPAGTRIQDRVGLIDIMPTLLDALDLEAPENLQGRSAMPLVRGETLPDRSLFAEWNRQVAKYEGSTKWIVTPRTGKTRIFDLTSDPEELAGIEKRLSKAETHSLLAEHERRCSGADETRDPAELDPRVRQRLRALGYLD